MFSRLNRLRIIQSWYIWVKYHGIKNDKSIYKDRGAYAASNLRVIPPMILPYKSLLNCHFLKYSAEFINVSNKEIIDISKVLPCPVMYTVKSAFNLALHIG